MRWFLYSFKEFIPQKPGHFISFFLNLGRLRWACPVDKLSVASSCYCLSLLEDQHFWTCHVLKVNVHFCHGSTGTELDDFSTCSSLSFLYHLLLWISAIYCCWYALTGSFGDCSLLCSPHHFGLHHCTNLGPLTISRPPIHKLFHLFRSTNTCGRLFV